VLLVSDEVICANGRIGSMFRLRRLRLRPDITPSAKGFDLGLLAAGRDGASDRLFEPSTTQDGLRHGYTFGGHPVSPRWRWPTWTFSSAKGHQRHDKEKRAGDQGHPGEALRAAHRRRRPRRGLLLRHRTGQGQWPPRDFNDEESERLQRGILSSALWEAGCTAAPTTVATSVQLAPPLISGQAEFDAIYDILHSVLTEPGTA
jgi:adenosylmethionine-8-amino-7-oxononanoate aminotransferase